MRDIFSVANDNIRAELRGKLLETRWMEQTSWEEGEEDDKREEEKKWERKDRSLMVLCVFPQSPNTSCCSAICCNTPRTQQLVSKTHPIPKR